MAQHFLKIPIKPIHKLSSYFATNQSNASLAEELEVVLCYFVFHNMRNYVSERPHKDWGINLYVCVSYTKLSFTLFYSYKISFIMWVYTAHVWYIKMQWFKKPDKLLVVSQGFIVRCLIKSFKIIGWKKPFCMSPQ